MTSPICFAADFQTLGTAANFIREHRLYDLIGAVKVGLELFISSGPRAVEVFQNDLAIPVVLDLKLHDIPETVARAVKAGGDLGVKYMTLHIQQQEALESAVKAAEPYGIKLLGVTVLTSMADTHLGDLGLMEPTVQRRVAHLAKYGYDAGLRGFVCSPHEVGHLRTQYADAFFLVPGVRPVGSSTDDQNRVGTPSKAVKDGANLIVIGRPIRDAKDPAEAARAILAEINPTSVPIV